MKTITLFVGDEEGLRDVFGGVDPKVMPKGFVGFSGEKAIYDPVFVSEMIVRRSALKLSAIGLSRAVGYSGGYVSMLENGSRHASEEAKERIRETLTRLENDK